MINPRLDDIYNFAISGFKEYWIFHQVSLKIIDLTLWHK